MKNKLRPIALVLLFFNALGAMYGGGSLIIDPSGTHLQLPLSFLEGSVFKDFFIPGILLFIINGVSNLFVGILGLKRHNLFPELTILCGILLIIWLYVQIQIIKEFFVPIHLPYFLIGILLTFIGLFLKNNKRGKANS